MLLRELFEQEAKHVTFCFGRMNPPTAGHEQVFRTMANVGGDYQIFLSQTQDKKENPLSYEEKIRFIKALHPQYADHIVENRELNTVVKVASYLYDQGYRQVTFVAGSDRLDSFKKLLTQYNGVEGKAHGYYNFELLDFESSGDRDPDSPGVAGVSASKARVAAANNDFDEFKKATGAGQIADEMFAAVRQGMGIKESIKENKMRAKDFIPPSKPRNPVVRQQQTSGAGVHKDKKKAQKQGDVKHKKKMFDEESGIGKTHISPSGVKTNMPPSDDDYAINYGKNGLVAKDRKARGVDVATGEKKVSEISKPAMARYVKAAGKDIEQRASSQSFKSGQAGDKYNKADPTHKDTRREKGIDRALSRLSK